MNYSTRRVAALLTACLSLTANVQAIPAPTPAPDPAILAKRIFTLQTVAQSVWDSELQAASSAAVVQASIQSAAEASAAPQIESDCAANKIVATDTAAWAQYSVYPDSISCVPFRRLTFTGWPLSRVLIGTLSCRNPNQHCKCIESGRAS